MIYMYGVAGMKINSYAAMKMTQLYKTGGGIQNTLKEYIDNAWSRSNPNAVYPRMTIVDNNTNMKSIRCLCEERRFPENSEHPDRLYLPKRWLQPLRMDNARIFASVENLACFSGYNKFRRSGSR